MHGAVVIHSDFVPLLYCSSRVGLIEFEKGRKKWRAPVEGVTPTPRVHRRHPNEQHLGRRPLQLRDDLLLLSRLLVLRGAAALVAEELLEEAVALFAFLL